MTPKVLLAAPTSSIKTYCWIDWWLNVKSFTYPDLDILIVDNSVGTANIEYLKTFGVKVLHVEPKNRTTQEFITESQNVIRKELLKGDYDYLFSLESDIFPQKKDVVERLMAHDLPIVSAPYFIGIGKESHLLINYLVKSFVAKNAAFGMNLPNKYGFLLMDGTVKQVNQCGIGCSLIKREVIEEIPFRFEKGREAHADSFFYTDLWYHGIPAFVDTSLAVRCFHYNQDWGLIHNTWRD